MIRLPKWWRRFKKKTLYADLIAGRKVIAKTTDDEGNVYYHVEKAPNREVA